jgi:hypothetical protein
MEDDIDDKLNDHPALLQVQQPFAQILSSASTGTNTGNMVGGNYQSTLNSVLSNGTNAVHAFLKGMEEANMLLPKGKNFQRDEPVVGRVRM